jgi:hypothetical protein
MGWKTWRRPTLPRLKTQYHGRWGFSRPSSGWDRVRAPRQSHQVIQPIRIGLNPGSGLCPRWAIATGLVPVVDLRIRCALAEDDFHAWFVLSSIGQLVPVSFARCRVSTPGLST